jgi:hypothetical protein
MGWPPPTARTLIALHIATGAPLVALAVWFGAVDRVPPGAGRCSSCGVEGYVIAVHLVAAAWLAAVIASVSAARRRLRTGIAAPGPATVRAIVAVALILGVAVVWHPLLGVPAAAALVLSIVVAPTSAIWWVLAAVVLWRSPPAAQALDARLKVASTASWVSLVVLLPAVFAWVWLDRVEWLVF